MDPVTLALLTQGLGGVFGGMFGRGKDRAEMKRRREIMRLSSPEHLSNLTNQLYGQFRGGPAYQQGQRGIFNSTTSTSNRLASSLASRGLNTSGVGSIAPALAGSAAAGQLGQLRTAGWNDASDRAYGLQGRQVQTAGGFGPNPNEAGAAIGGSMGDLSSLLMSLFGNKGMPKAKVRRAANPGAGGTY